MAKTIFEHRLLASLVLCLSGLALLPFDLLSSRVFGWEQLAGTYELIFSDDFEIGTSKRWPERAPENFRVFPARDAESFDQVYRIDQELISHYDDGVVLMAGFAPDGEPLFSIEARTTEFGLAVRSGAALDGGEWRDSSWHELGPDSLLGVEWQQGHSQAEDGFVYLTVDGQLQVWLTDLDNDSRGLEVTALTQFGARTLLSPQISAQ